MNGNQWKLIGSNDDNRCDLVALDLMGFMIGF
jgi:hypothetical protein